MHLIFRLRWVACIAICGGAAFSAHATQLLINGDTFISHGLLSENYWSRRALIDNDEALIAHVDLVKRVDFEVLNQRFFVESRSVASMTTTRNSLTLFAKGDAAQSLLQDKTIGLDGSLLSYSFHAVGMQMDGSYEDKRWFWRVSPKLLKITSFKSDTGSGTFSRFGETQKLTADTHSIGFWEYGFFENGTQAVNFGNGIATDLQLRYSEENLSVEFSAENLFSRVTNYGLFYNSKKYQAESRNSLIISNALPAMSGTYGQQDFVSSLPIFSRFLVEYRLPDHSVKLSAGFDTLDNTSRGWGAMAAAHNDLMIHLKTYGFQNLALICQVNNLWARGLTVGLGLESDLKGEWQFNAARLSYSF